MNIPFRFLLNTTAGGKVYGRLFETLAGATTYDLNRVFNDWENGNAVFGADRTARFSNMGVPLTFLGNPRPLYLTGLSLAAYFTADIGAEIDFGLWSISNATFLTIYPCVATSTNSGGMVHSGHVYENGFRINWTADLIPAFRATKQTATDGAVTIAGHVSVITESN